MNLQRSFTVYSKKYTKQLSGNRFRIEKKNRYEKNTNYMDFSASV